MGFTSKYKYRLRQKNKENESSVKEKIRKKYDGWAESERDILWDCPIPAIFLMFTIKKKGKFASVCLYKHQIQKTALDEQNRAMIFC